MFYTAIVVAIAAISLCVVYGNRIYATYASLKFLVNGRRMLAEAAEEVRYHDYSVVTYLLMRAIMPAQRCAFFNTDPRKQVACSL